jgi:hypothetical protein
MKLFEFLARLDATPGAASEAHDIMRRLNALTDAQPETMQELRELALRGAALLELLFDRAPVPVPKPPEPPVVEKMPVHVQVNRPGGSLPGAAVTLYDVTGTADSDGHLVLYLPTSLALALLTIQADGFQPWSGTVRVERDLTLTVSMERVAPPAPTPGQDEIDPREITVLSPCTTADVLSWPITSEVTRAYQEDRRVGVEHTQSGVWPLADVFQDGNGANIEGNIGIVVRVDGRWYGAGFDWLGEGRTEKTIAAAEFGRDQIRVAPLDASWPGPQPGDVVGLFATTPSSDRIGVRTVNERSNIKVVTWR